MSIDGVQDGHKHVLRDFFWCLVEINFGHR
jgi:hypothetical protein